MAKDNGFNIIKNVLIAVGRGLEKAVVVTAKNIYGGAKYIAESPREIVKDGNAKRAEADHEFLYQVIFYHTGESRLNAIEKLKTQFPAEYNKILPTINKDNTRFNLDPMQPV